LFASISFPTIGHPIRFSYHGFKLEEFQTNNIPSSLYQEFIDFCYPTDIPDRTQQIERDKRLYWNDTTTFIVFDLTGKIVGCIQIVSKSLLTKLPIEYAYVMYPNGERKNFDIRSVAPEGEVTEIYRFRRSFTLKDIDTFYVLIMLFKAVWVKTVQLGTSYSFISFDAKEKSLQHLYRRKLSFSDPGITLMFEKDPTPWSLLVKDWDLHNKKFATIAKKQFYMQTWFRRGIKQRGFKIREVINDSPGVKK
jgi:hypothetical protein